MPLKVKGNKQKEMIDRKRKPKHKKYKSEIVNPDKELATANNRDSAASSSSRPGERLLNLLRSHAVCRKEVHGIRVTNRVLEQLTAQEIRDLRSVFEIFDVNSDGYLGPVEVWQALTTLGFTVSRKEAVQLVQTTNLGERREVSLSEFLEIVIDRQQDARDSDCEIMKAFTLLDLDGTGKVSAETLEQVCVESGVPLTWKELDEMIEEADINGDGYIDQAEFLRIMLQTSLF